MNYLMFEPILIYMLLFYCVILSYLIDQSAGKLCIEVTTASKIAFISEELCIGCGICVKVSKKYFLSHFLLFYTLLRFKSFFSFLSFCDIVSCYDVEMPV